MEKLGSAVGIAIERLVLQICVIHRVKPEALLLREVYIDTNGILALVERVQLRGKPVAVAADKGREVGNWPRIQDADAVRAKSVDRDDVGTASHARASGTVIGVRGIR